MKKICLIGDVHGKFHTLNKIVKEEMHLGIDTFICCGEFGVWPDYKEFNDLSIMDGAKLLFCDGNHEDHPYLKKLHKDKDDSFAEIKPNIIHISRGGIVEIFGKKFLFIGGAESVDYSTRTPGLDWFPEESISASEAEKAMSVGKVDVVISHTCPSKFKAFPQYKDSYSQFALDAILDTSRPSEWFFSHYHMTTNGKYVFEDTDEITNFHCINMVPFFGSKNYYFC